MLIGADPPSMVMMLFNRLIQQLLPQMNRDPINVDNDDQHGKELEATQRQNNNGKDT